MEMYMNSEENVYLRVFPIHFWHPFPRKLPAKGRSTRKNLFQNSKFIDIFIWFYAIKDRLVKRGGQQGSRE